ARRSRAIGAPSWASAARRKRERPQLPCPRERPRALPPPRSQDLEPSIRRTKTAREICPWRRERAIPMCASTTRPRSSPPMATLTKKCTICGSDFEPHFSYQMEEREERDADGVPTVRFAFFCSQDCLERSHRGGDDGTVCCDACATGF